MPLPTDEEEILKRNKFERRTTRFAGLLGVLSSWLCFEEYAEYVVFSNYLTKVKSAETVPVSDLRSILTEDGEDKLAIVRGTIKVKPLMKPTWRWSPDLDDMIALKSFSSGEKSDHCVASQAISRVTSPYFFWGEIPFVKTRNRAIPFAITDGGGCVVVNLYHQPNAIHPVPFNTIFRLEPSPELEEPLGLLEEKILPLGKEITAIGKLCFRRGSYPQIEPCADLPYFLSDMTKEEMIQDVASSRYYKLCSVFALGTVSIFLLGYALRGRWKSIGKWLRDNVWGCPLDSSHDDEHKHDDKATAALGDCGH